MNIFMQDELMMQIEFWRDETDQLHRIIPRECLPVEYGGDLPESEILRGITIKTIIFDEAESLNRTDINFSFRYISDQFYDDLKSNEAWLKYIASVRADVEQTKEETNTDCKVVNSN